VKFFGNIDLNDNQIKQAVLGQENDFPANPQVGRIVFKNSRVFVAVNIDGLITWIPLTNVINTYLHTQPTAADTWNVSHNLNTTTPLVQVYEEGTNKMFIPDNITIVDNNNLTINMTTPVSGRAVVMSGELTGTGVPAYSFVYEQTTPNAVWTIVHGLGYHPLVRVFVGNQEVQPLSITHDSITQTTITFSSPQTGVARLI
jgi:hypothetical protein